MTEPRKIWCYPVLWLNIPRCFNLFVQRESQHPDSPFFERRPYECWLGTYHFMWGNPQPGFEIEVRGRFKIAYE